MALPKVHHIETLSEFNLLKFSYDSTNTHYFTGGTDTVVAGTPDILYTDIAYIKPLSAIYTHAKIYPCPVLEYDSEPTANSSKLVNSGCVYTAISGKQPTITGAASTITTANLTASKVLGSDASGKVAATSIATADAEDAILKKHAQNTDTQIVSPNGSCKIEAKNSANEVTGQLSVFGAIYATNHIQAIGGSIITSNGGNLSISGNGVIAGNLSVSGDLNVTGTMTVEKVVEVVSQNNFITLREDAVTAIPSGSLSGIRVVNYDGLNNDLLFGTDASGVFRIGDEGGTLEPIATRDEASNLSDGQLMKWDAANQRMVGINDIRANTVNGAPLSNAASYFYGVSTSAADSTQKEVSIPSITTLNAGQVIVVTATNPSDHINNATLKLNNFTAYPISVKNNYFANSKVIGTGLSIFMFDGSKWCMLNWDSAYDAISVKEGTAGTSTAVRLVRADYLQQIIHAQIDKFVGTRAMTEDAYWDLVTAGTVQSDTLYITYDNDWEG